MRPESWLSELSFWLRSLLHRRGLDQELDDEIIYHIEAKTEENMAKGMNKEEARRAARIGLGGVAQGKRGCVQYAQGHGLRPFYKIYASAFGRSAKIGLRRRRRSRPDSRHWREHGEDMDAFFCCRERVAEPCGVLSHCFK
jgi:hypothetical protein